MYDIKLIKIYFQTTRMNRPPYTERKKFFETQLKENGNS